jgi:hypothetical protein
MAKTSTRSNRDSNVEPRRKLRRWVYLPPAIITLAVVAFCISRIPVGDAQPKGLCGVPWVVTTDNGFVTINFNYPVTDPSEGAVRGKLPYPQGERLSDLLAVVKEKNGGSPAPLSAVDGMLHLKMRSQILPSDFKIAAWSALGCDLRKVLSDEDVMQVQNR